MKKIIKWLLILIVFGVITTCVSIKINDGDKNIEVEKKIEFNAKQD